MSYLDPVSFGSFSQTSRIFYRLSHSEAQQEYFKALTIATFNSNLPCLPADCKFEEVRNYVLSHPI